MKTLYLIALQAALFMCLQQVSAQSSPVLLNTPNYNKPKFFADVPDRLPLKVADLESLLTLPVGRMVVINLSKTVVLRGVIVSLSNPADKTVKSVVVKSNSRPGTFLTFTRLAEKDGSFSYLGRLISREGGDALEITRDGNNYILRKKNIHDVVSE